MLRLHRHRPQRHILQTRLVRQLLNSLRRFNRLCQIQFRDPATRRRKREARGLHFEAGVRQPPFDHAGRLPRPRDPLPSSRHGSAAIKNRHRSNLHFSQSPCTLLMSCSRRRLRLPSTQGGCMLIDAHVHLFSRRFYQFWADEARVPIEQTAETLKAEIPDDDSVPLGERWIAELDKYKVDRCVLISSVTGDGGALGKTVQKHPSRLSGLFYLNPTLQDAMQRVRRGVEEAGLRGACFFPAMHHYQPDDERLHPIFATLDRAGVVAFVHLGMFKMPIQEKLGLPPSADLKYSNPIALHSVCNAFQNLKFIIPHFGSGFFQETLMLGTLCKNVYIDTSSSNSWI